MPVVIPLRDCVARPDVDGQRFGLIDHLVAVAERCGRPDGPPEEKLAFLGGLLHDGAKSTDAWQAYIRSPGSMPSPHPHAPAGAAFFAFWAEDLIPLWCADPASRRNLTDLALDWTRIVYDHHSAIDDLGELPPWDESSAGSELLPLVDACDKTGLNRLVRLFFPETGVDFTAFPAWLDSFGKTWQRRLQQDRKTLLRQLRKARTQDPVPLAREGLRLARLGARLIFADRSHAAEWDVWHLSSGEATGGTKVLEQYCRECAAEALKKKADPELVRLRGELQSEALEAYRSDPGRLLYALLLPTGFGKTLAGLRVALEACGAGRCRRIVYVAPYLTILSQAADEIRRASGLEVFVHHHLSAALLADHEPYDVIDTWQTPILATTFNQLCRTLFPRRAQQCLRIPALKGAFLLIDEPQILSTEVWNLFLRALATVARENEAQVLFLTATLPHTEDGLGERPADLVSASRIAALPTGRYRIIATNERWHPDRVAKEARARLDRLPSVAVILNTIRDAAAVFDRVKGDGEWRFLTAMMLPGHKLQRIQEIRFRLERQRDGEMVRTGVVCTTVLEAGVDLSFAALLRALPIFPSVIQAAGRANRHKESSEPAEVIVFPYVRPDGTDSRPYIYRNETAREQTDAVFRRHPVLPEEDVAIALREFFDGYRESDPLTACLARLEDAAQGEWSKVAGLKPFEDDVPRLEVFIPNSDRYLHEKMRPLMARYAPGGSGQLLANYLNRSYRRSLDFLGRKRIMALLRQFCVAVPRQHAERISEPTEAEWLRQLSDTVAYSDEFGLAHLLEEADDAEGTVLF